MRGAVPVTVPETVKAFIVAFIDWLFPVNQNEPFAEKKLPSSITAFGDQFDTTLSTATLE